MYLLHVQTELIGITNRKRKPPLKEDAVPSIFSYVPEKKVRQASIDRASRQTKQEVSFHYKMSRLTKDNFVKINVHIHKYIYLHFLLVT